MAWNKTGSTGPKKKQLKPCKFCNGGPFVWGRNAAGNWQLFEPQPGAFDPTPDLSKPHTCKMQGTAAGLITGDTAMLTLACPECFAQASMRRADIERSGAPICGKCSTYYVQGLDADTLSMKGGPVAEQAAV